MNSDKEKVKSATASLVSRIEQMTKDSLNTQAFLGDLVLTLTKDFAGDVGIIVIYFLNHVKLEVNEYN